MSKVFGFQDINARRHYILTGSQKTPIQDIVDMVEEADYQWLNKARRLRERRWRRLRSTED
jgi:hypothetical protein